MLGAGIVGRRAAELLAASPDVGEVTVHRRFGSNARPLGIEGVAERDWVAGEPFRPAEVVVLAAPESVLRTARAAVEAGRHVVCPVDDPSVVRDLLALDGLARQKGCSLVVGAAMAPGLSCVLAGRLKAGLDRLSEIHVASFGTGGPACAHRHHDALTGTALDWERGTWRRRAAGSGRELVWFPDPVGPADCYRAATADPILLAATVPECRRITARMAATRRDRLTSWLPMMRRPHPEGLVGAVRVEARGWVEGRAVTRVLGAAQPPGRVAGAVCAIAACWALQGRLARAGAGGLGSLIADPGAFLAELAPAGVLIEEFTGSEL